MPFNMTSLYILGFQVTRPPTGAYFIHLCLLFVGELPGELQSINCDKKTPAPGYQTALLLSPVILVRKCLIGIRA